MQDSTPHALKLDTNRKNAFTNSFILMTWDWKSLPPTVFPAAYNLRSFKTRIHRYLQLRPNPQISSYFHDTWVHQGLQRLYLFGATSSCINLIIKKNQTSFWTKSEIPAAYIYIAIFRQTQIVLIDIGSTWVYFRENCSCIRLNFKKYLLSLFLFITSCITLSNKFKLSFT